MNGTLPRPGTCLDASMQRLNQIVQKLEREPLSLPERRSLLYDAAAHLHLARFIITESRLRTIRIEDECLSVHSDRTFNP